MASERNAGARPPAGSLRAARDDRRSALPPLSVFPIRYRVGALIGGRAVRQAGKISVGQDTKLTAREGAGFGLCSELLPGRAMALGRVRAASHGRRIFRFQQVEAHHPRRPPLGEL